MQRVSLRGTSTATVILVVDHDGPAERHDALMVLAQIVVTVVLVIWLTVIVYRRRRRRRGHYQSHGVRLVASKICTKSKSIFIRRNILMTTVQGGKY
jgi:heme/copper-type cytochrome/quinol oxidase subunit 2